MATPSMLIVPDRYKSGVLYSQLPESGAVDLDVTRATTAYRTNASGILESVASGVPRLDYPAAGGCPSLLVEPAATNLILRSEEFDDVAWTKDDVTITANTQNAPNNTVTADTITAAATNSRHDVNSLASFTSGVTYSLSCHFKKGTTRYAYIGSSSTGWSFVAIIDLDTGLITNLTAGATADVRLINGFYRLTISATATSTAIMRLRFGLTSSPTATITNLTTSDTIIAWGAQLETGSVATSYIPTVAATATRNADVISKTAVSGFIGQTEGTIYAEVNVSLLLGSVSRGILAISDGTASNRVQLLFTTAASNTIRAIVQNSLTDTINFPVSSLGIYKLAIAYSVGGTSVLFINGSEVGTAGCGAFSANMSKVNLGTSVSDASQFNDHIRAAAIYTTRLEDDELIALTTL